MAQAIARSTIPLPKGFKSRKHSGALSQVNADQKGEGREVDSNDPEGGQRQPLRWLRRPTEIAKSDVARCHRGRALPVGPRHPMR